MQFNNKFRIFGLIIGVLVLAGLVGVMALTVQRAQQLTSTITRPKASGITWSCTGGSGSSEVGWCGGWGVCHGDCPCGCGGYLPYPGGPTSKDCKPSFGNYVCSWDAPNVACHSATKVDCSSKGDQNSCQAVSGCNWTASSDSCTNPFSPSYSQPQGQLSGVTPGTFVWTWCDPSVINWSTVYLWNCNPANCNGAFAKADGGGHANGNISLSNFTMISGGGAVSLQPNTQYWWTLNPNSCASYPSVNCPVGSGPGAASFTTGAAAPVCPSGQTLCGTTCVNLQTDSNNCRTCGGICPSGQTCSSGTCTVTCSGTTPDLCGTACTNKQTDVNNCGACGNVCLSGQTCTNSACTQASASKTCTQAAFSDSFGSAIDASVWSINLPENTGAGSVGGNVSVANGVLTMSSPVPPTGKTYNSANVASKTVLTGDFSLEAAVGSLTVGTGNSAGTAEIAIDNLARTDGIHLAWRKTPADGSFVDMASQGKWTSKFSVTGASSLKLKLVRSGSSVQGYVDTGSGYQSVGTLQNIFTGDGVLMLLTYNSQGSNVVSATFDNFSLACPATSSGEADACWGNGGTGTNAGRCYDCNGDGTVNILDFSCFRLNWLKSVQ